MLTQRLSLSPSHPLGEISGGEGLFQPQAGLSSGRGDVDKVTVSLNLLSVFNFFSSGGVLEFLHWKPGLPGGLFCPWDSWVTAERGWDQFMDNCRLHSQDRSLYADCLMHGWADSFWAPWQVVLDLTGLTKGCWPQMRNILVMLVMPLQK